jgi:streptogramin lyase
MFTTLTRWFRKSRSRAATPAHRRKPDWVRLRLEALEPRELPTADTLALAWGMPPAVAGVPAAVTVTANTSAGIDTGFLGAVHFGSSDPQATLPADYTFTAADAGSHTFTVIFQRSGRPTLTVSAVAGSWQVGAPVSLQVPTTGTYWTLGGAVAGPDGNTWVTETQAGQIARITPAGAITQFSLPGLHQPNQITAGPDGNLWFTEAATDRIGRITPAGAVTEFPVTTGSYPTGITVGLDGNLWFAEYWASRIGRITPGGAVTEYAIPTVGGGPSAVTVGGDGNIWFNEEQGNRIGRITPTGVVTEFAVPTAGSDPCEPVRGGDGSVWFTEDNTGKIGRITASGVITEFTIPTPNSVPLGTTLGPDGSVWFTERGASKVGQITPQGVITEYAIGGGTARPTMVTIGADGGVWVLDPPSERIFRFPLTSSAPTPVTAGIQVQPGSATRFTVTASPATAGQPTSVTVTAQDAFGNVVTGYAGAVHFTSSDVWSALPADYTFTTADAGSHTFPLTLATIGNQSVTVADTAGACTSGVSIQVNAPAWLPGATSAAVVQAGPGHTAVFTPGSNGLYWYTPAQGLCWASSSGKPVAVTATGVVTDKGTYTWFDSLGGRTALGQTVLYDGKGTYYVLGGDEGGGWARLDAYAADHTFICQILYAVRSISTDGAGDVYALMTDGSLDLCASGRATQILSGNVQSVIQGAPGHTFILGGGTLYWYSPAQGLNWVESNVRTVTDDGSTVVTNNDTLYWFTTAQGLTALVKGTVDGSGAVWYLDSGGNLFMHTAGGWIAEAPGRNVLAFQVDGSGAVWYLDSGGNLFMHTAGGWIAKDVLVNKFTVTNGQVVVDDWFSRNLPDPGVAAAVRGDLVGHGSVTRSDLLTGILPVVEADSVVTFAELTSLRNVSGVAAPLNTTAQTQYLLQQVVFDNPADRHYQEQTLPQLVGGTGAWVLQDLVNKWFLGADHPATTDAFFKFGPAAAAYSAVGGNLFGPSAQPTYTDVQQGEVVGDCWLLAAFADDAGRAADVASAFTDNGDGTWAVRLYLNGLPAYVTVDNQLPDGGNQLPDGGYTYASVHPKGGQNILWVGLLEKAFAQLNEVGQFGMTNGENGQNSYAALNGGSSAVAFHALTGRVGTGVWTSAPLAVVGTPGGDKAIQVPGTNPPEYMAPGHAYAVLGRDASTGLFTRFNPWGVNGGTNPGDGIYCAGVLHLTRDQINSVCGLNWAVGTAPYARSSGTATIDDNHNLGNEKGRRKEPDDLCQILLECYKAQTRKDLRLED